MSNTLFLRLEGPMQSWGERSPWKYRDSAREPTKSGVVGLLACALGVSNDEDLRHLSGQIRIGVRCDKSGRMLTDYHTVGGGHKDQGVLRQATGELKPPTYIEQTYRSYLHDASFLVAVLASESNLIDKLANALRNPHWPIFLGRKSCPLAYPPLEGIGDYDSLKTALETWGKTEWPEHTNVRAVIECLPSDPQAIMRRDEVDLHSHARWTFLPRYSKEIFLPKAHVKVKEV